MTLPRALAARVPFYYGWVVLAALCCVGFARQGSAVATLSIFVEPLTREFGWTRTALSGAVSLGGLLAALASPFIGPFLDRRGSRLVLCVAVLVNAGALALLSFTPSLLYFYLFFCIARMNWAVPFDLGIYGAISNWFVARRGLATSVGTLAQMSGLVAMPLIAQAAIVQESWRTAWLALGILTLLAGFLPAWLLLARRPEDLGLAPDGARAAASSGYIHTEEPRYSRREAMATPAFWLLMLYTALVYPVQAGVSLHQAAHLIEHGIAPMTAATVVSVFSFMSGVGTLACAFSPRRLPIRFLLALAGGLISLGVFLMIGIADARDGFIAAGIYGFGIGGILTLLPIAWADYFGRANFGAIRGVALSVQVIAQACGPLVSGALRDLTGSYASAFYAFCALALLSALAALAARRPRLSAARL